MKIILVMAKVFNTPINVWLDMELPMLYDWVGIADQIVQEERAKNNMQMVGPGL
jgi:hypothetical protein